MKIKAYAKVNLTLEVLGVRSDGYHDLRSVVMPVSLADDIFIEESDKLKIDVEFLPEFPQEEITQNLLEILKSPKNLAYKAAECFARKCGKEPKIKIIIKKRIPVGGGLGGGSADAAAVLRGLNKFWQVNLSPWELAEIGAEIGSDVPALAFGGAVIMEGRGERVRPLFTEKETYKIPELWLVLANPGINVPTKEVFSKWQKVNNPKKDSSSDIFDLTKGGDLLDNIVSLIQSGQVDYLSKAMVNDLAEPAMECFPEIRVVSEALRNAGAVAVQVTGSGATVFGYVRSKAHGIEVLGKMAGVWTTLQQICPIV